MIRVAVKGLVFRRTRLILTGLAIVLGVAFLTATFVVSDSIKQGADQAFSSFSTASDIEVRARAAFDESNPSEAVREPMPASVLGDVLDVPGVAAAAGHVEGLVTVVPAGDEDAGGGFSASVGVSADGLGDLSPFTLAEGRAPEGSDEVVVDVATAGDDDLAVGDAVTVLGVGAPAQATVVGLVKLGDRDGIAGIRFSLFDLETAQALLGREGRLDGVLVAAADDVTIPELRRRLDAALPSDVEAVTSALRAAEKSDGIKDGAKITGIMLRAFAGVALFVGAFTIFNTFSVIVAQRTKELALLRAVGAGQRQVKRSVVLEAVAIAAVASAIGVVAGIGLGAAMQAFIRFVGVEFPDNGTTIAPRTVIAPFVMGIVVTAVASYLPARRAGTVAPIAALRDVEQHVRSPRRRYIAGGLLVVIGVVGGFLATPLLLVGAVLVAPLAVRPVTRLIGRLATALGGFAGRLGRENTLRNPMRTASTASALMVGLSLVVGMAIVAQSALSSFTDALNRSVKADFIAEAGASGLSTDFADALAGRPELGVISPHRYGPFELVGIDEVRTPEENGTQYLSGIDPATFAETMDVDVVAGSVDDLADGGVLVLDDVIERQGWDVGDTIQARFAKTGVQRVRIDGIYTDGTLFSEGFLLSLGDFEANYTDQRDVRVLVNAAPGVSTEAAREAMNDVAGTYTAAEVNDRSGYKEEAAAQVDIILGAVAMLLGLAVVIAVLGIVNTLALSVFERTRELGLLRAVGMSRRQVRSMVRWESVLISVLGAGLALLVGLAVGAALVKALANEMESITLQLPYFRLVLFVALGVVVGVVAAILPARRAAGTNVLEAVRVS